MKKIFSFLVVSLLTFGFTACDDVPAPYGIDDELPLDSTIFRAPMAGGMDGMMNYGGTEEWQWVADSKYGCVKVSGHVGGKEGKNYPGEAFLVTPEISLEKVSEAHVMYQSALAYRGSLANQKLLITDKFNPEKPNEGWTVLKDSHKEGEEFFTWIKEDVQIPGEMLGKKVRIAFQYICTASDAKTWEVKGLKVEKGKAANDGGDDPVKPEEGVVYNGDLTKGLGDFVNKTTDGTGAWAYDAAHSVVVAKAYNPDTEKTTPGTYYLVSPAISLDKVKEAHVTYNYVVAYNKNNKDQQFMINANYDEANPAAGWELLKDDHIANEIKDWTTRDADIQIPAKYIGKSVRFGFRYHAEASGASTWQLANMKVLEGKAKGEEVKPEVEAIFSAALSSDSEGFKNYLGTPEWKWTIDSSWGCAKVSGHVGGKEGHKVPGKAYFVSPEISLEGVAEAHLSYSYAIGYMSLPQYHKVFVSANFNEADPEANWTELPATHKVGERNFSWFDNDLQIPASMVGKKIRIAFYYECDAEKGSTFEIKDVKVLKGKAAEGGNEGGNEGGTTPDVGDVNAANGDFECWVGGLPNNWSSVAGNGHLHQSTEAHSGKYSVMIEGYKSNKRLAYKVIELQPGTYNIKYYVKAATEKGGATKAGYAIVTDGVIADTMHDYVYSDFFNDLNMQEWKEINHTITIEKAGTYSMLVMNCKNPGADILVDDYTLTDADGNVIIK